MARDGLSVRRASGAALLVLSLPLVLLSAVCGEERDNSIAATLQVQTALQQGREQLLHGNAQQAVYLLESQLARINGSREYLNTLRDAYRAYIKELRLANKNSEAEEYLKRLRILDPGASLDPAMCRPGVVETGNPAPPVAPPAASPPVRAAAKEAPARPVETPAVATPRAPTARGKMDDDPSIRPAGEHDPFQVANAAPTVAAPPVAETPVVPSLLEQAEQEFIQGHYDAAGPLFAQASQANLPLSGADKEQWAYCKFHRVVQQLNQSSGSGAPDASLEEEVRLALSLAPKFEDYGKGLLRKIQERHSSAAGPAVAVRHLEQQADGQSIAETTNFRIHHNQPRELVEKVARIAETTRTAMLRKWFGEPGEEWSARCDIYLHATTDDYVRLTGMRANSPGHSTIKSDGGRIVSRSIDLHCDDAGMLNAVLPHETTHVTLAGKFGEFAVPRWADEGMAMQSEPRENMDRYQRLVRQFHQEQRLLSAQQLLHLQDWPDPRHIDAFYAESASLVEFLTRGDKGPQTFSQFLQDSLRHSPEAALKRYYNIQDINELEQRWHRDAFGGSTVAARP